MYVQVSRARYQPDRFDEAIAIIRDSVFPAARQQQGFVAAKFAIDRETATGIGMSFWQTQADADALVSSGFYQEQVAKLGPLLLGQPERELYEVALEA